MARETIRELYLTNAKLPAIVNRSARDRFRQDFAIRCICHVNILGSRHTIMSKRAESTFGNKPGVVLHIHGNRVELLTFGDGDTQWHCLLSNADVRKGGIPIMAGERYEIFAGRKGKQGILYINGRPCVDIINSLHCDLPGFIGGVSAGDVNCDEPLRIGMHRFSGRNYWKFDGKIEFLGLYNNIELPRGLLRYAPYRTWKPLNDVAEEIGTPTKGIFTL